MVSLHSLSIIDVVAHQMYHIFSALQTRLNTCVLFEMSLCPKGGGSFTFPAFRIQLKCLPIQLIVDGHLNNRQEFKLHSQFKSKTAVSYQILQIDV